jgi:hypothetical protein
VLAATRFELRVKPEVDQRIFSRSGDDVDGTAKAAVASVRTAARDELLPPETQTAATAVAGGDMDVHLIDEHLGSV